MVREAGYFISVAVRPRRIRRMEVKYLARHQLLSAGLEVFDLAGLTFRGFATNSRDLDEYSVTVDLVLFTVLS